MPQKYKNLINWGLLLCMIIFGVMLTQLDSKPSHVRGLVSESPQIQWESWFPYTARDVIQTSDGGFALFGSSKYEGDNTLLCKVSSQGEHEWCTSFDWPYQAITALAGIQLSDGGFAIVGHNEYHRAVLTTTFADGNLRNASTYGYGGDGEFHAVIEGEGETLYLAGFTRFDPIRDINDPWLLKVDFDCNVLWDKLYGLPNPVDERIYDAKRTSDSGLILAGMRLSYEPIKKRILLLKIDADGNLEWESLWEDIGFSIGRAVIQTTDGGYTVLGDIAYGGGHYENFALARFDAME